MSQVKVFGHTPPDTDSVASAIVYSWYLNTFKGMDTVPAIGAEPNREALFVLKYFNQEKPDPIGELTPGQEVVIVDTNNPEELPQGIEECVILEIVDHHKLSGLKNGHPLSVTLRGYASVPTIIWEIMSSEERTQISKEMAGLMLSAILSDSLKFTSSTTTSKDIEVAQELARISGEDIDNLAEKMFAAKSNLEGMSNREVLLSDSKTFELSGKQCIVAVLETTHPDQALSKKEDLASEMENIKKDENADAMFFFVVDIINNKAIVFKPLGSESDIIEKAFGEKFNEEGIIELPGMVSRKKDLIPRLTEALAG